VAIDPTELVEHVVNQLEDAVLDQALMLNCYSYDGDIWLELYDGDALPLVIDREEVIHGMMDYAGFDPKRHDGDPGLAETWQEDGRDSEYIAGLVDTLNHFLQV